MSESSLMVAAEIILDIQTRYANRGLSMAQLALAGAERFVEFRHYPKNDLIDHVSGYEMYYHSHSLGEGREEHGHFHLFKRDPLAPELFTHLVAISLNQQGLPIRLFTTNQWVTGESIRAAVQSQIPLQNFEIHSKGRMGPLAKWVSSLVHLYLAEISALLDQRDQRIQELITPDQPQAMILQDRQHHVLSELNISLLDKLEEVMH